MSQENISRPRRAGTNYGPMPPPRDPLLNIPLSLKRKEWIMHFKKVNKNGQSSEKWLQKLYHFLKEKDEQILLEDVRRWVENHPWISIAGGQPPDALKVRNHEDAVPSKSTTTPKKNGSSAYSSVHQTTPSNVEKKVTFKKPELEVHYISPRPHKAPPIPRIGPKLRLPKPPPGYFSKNN